VNEPCETCGRKGWHRCIAAEEIEKLENDIRKMKISRRKLLEKKNKQEADRNYYILALKQQISTLKGK